MDNPGQPPAHYPAVGPDGEPADAAQIEIQEEDKKKKLHNPFFLCGLFQGIRSIGYFDICSVFIDLFLLVLTFIGRYPYNAWAVISILRGIAMLGLVSIPRLIWFALLSRSNYHPGKAKQCCFVRLVTMGVQIPLYLLLLIQIFADDEYMGIGIHKAVDAIFEILVVAAIMGLNGYLTFLFFYYGRNGMDLHLRYKEGLRLKKLRKREGPVDEFGMPTN